MAPQGDMLSLMTDSIQVHWQDANSDEREEENVALVSSRPAVSKTTSNTLRKKHQRRIAILSVAIALVVVVVATRSLSFLYSSETTTRSKQSIPDVITEQGWLGALEDFRKEFVALAVKLDLQEEEEGNNDFENKDKSQLVDISLMYDKIEYALQTFGLRAVYSQLFTDLEYYFPESWEYTLDDDLTETYTTEECDAHGIGCTWIDLWWLYHYTGAITAEMLFRDGSVLLDGVTQQHLYSGVEIMKEIHRIQEVPYAPAMSFHAEHGFIWYYVAKTMPNLSEYPTKLAHDFCGDYDYNLVYSRVAKKKIGYECYHGFGHAVYVVVALRQIDPDFAGNLTAREQIRPHGGFTLSTPSFCDTQSICTTAPNATKAPQKACYGGIRHSYKLFSNTLPRFESKYENREYFEQLRVEKCLS